jgi:hypothetical protein
MKKLTLLMAGVAFGALLSMTPAKADTFVTLGGVQWNTTNSGNLSLGNFVPGGNQPQNAPCVICGENQPQQPANFGYNDYSNAGNTSAISAFSDQGNGGRNTLADDTFATGYQVGSGSPLLAFLLANGDNPNNLTFSIGVDINSTNVAETLNSFWFLNLTTHTVLASFTGGATGNVPDVNNGTGFPDYTISGFDLTNNDIHVGDTVLFLARMSGLNDGPDSFFVEAAPAAAVPEPGTLAIFGSALLGFGAVGWFRRRKDNGIDGAAA